MGPELIKNGSFENLSASFLADTTGHPFPKTVTDPGTIADPGTMTLVEGSNMLRDWFVPYGPIGLMTSKTVRVNPYHIGPPGPDAGQYFLDLTCNGRRPKYGEICQFIPTHRGRYQISLALGVADVAGPTSGPVAVQVSFHSLANHIWPLGWTFFRVDRGEIQPSDYGQWKMCTQEILLDEDTTPFEKADEEIVELLARLRHKPTDQRYTMIRITAADMDALRIGNPSHFVGLDSVSVRYVGPPPPPPGWSRHK